MSLTKREKTLLILLGILGMIYVSVNLLILPAYTSLTQLQTEKENLQFEKNAIALKISTKDSVMLKYENCKKEIIDTQKLFESDYNYTTIDKTITNLCTNAGLRVKALNMEDPIPISGTNTNEEESKAAESTPVPAQSGDETTQDNDTENKEKIPTAYYTTVQVHASGSNLHVKNLIKRVEKETFLRIISMNFNPKQPNDEYNSNRGVTFVFSVYLKDIMNVNEP